MSTDLESQTAHPHHEVLRITPPPPPLTPRPRRKKIAGILWTAGRAGTYKVNSVKYKKTNVNVTAEPTRLYLKPKEEL